MPPPAEERSDATARFFQQADEISTAYQTRLVAWQAHVHALATRFNTCHHHARAASASDGKMFADALTLEARRTQAACDALTQELLTLLTELQEQLTALLPADS